MADIDTSPEAVGRLAERVTAIPVLGPTDRQRVAATLRALSSKVARVEAWAKAADERATEYAPRCDECGETSTHGHWTIVDHRHACDEHAKDAIAGYWRRDEDVSDWLAARDAARGGAR